MKCKGCGRIFQQKRAGQYYCCKGCRLRSASKRYYHRNIDKCRNRFRVSKDSGDTVYYNITRRCNNPNDTHFKYYGGKGVKCLLSKKQFLDFLNSSNVCELCRWDFGNNRQNADGKTVDRINVDGHYEISNIRLICKSCNSKRTRWSRSRRNRQNIVGIKAGCFTLIHSGHITALREAKKHCDWLIVLTNLDRRIKKKKGCIPIPLMDRMKILSSIEYVDEVHPFQDQTEELWVNVFKTTRLHQEFGKHAKLVVFHDPEVEHNPPCLGIADDLIFIPRIDVSVTDIFQSIRTTQV